MHLPLGPAPVQALVNLTNDGDLSVWGQRAVYQARTTLTEQGRAVTTYRAVSAWAVERYDRSEVRVFDARGKELDAKEWPRLVKGETLALVAVDGRPVDPLHLRLIKDGTLVFVLPAPRPVVAPPVAPAVARPAPVAPPAPAAPDASPPVAVPPPTRPDLAPPAVPAPSPEELPAP
jgi:hypothetical protein